MKTAQQLKTHFILFALAMILFAACKKTADQEIADQVANSSKGKPALIDKSLLGSKAYCSTLPAAPAALAKTQSANRAVTQQNTIFNTDFVSAGVGGMRNVGNGVIALTGLTGTVTKAYLYWHGVSNSTTDVGNPITVNGIAVTGANIGYSDNNCWSYLNSQAYRADITSIVQAVGNGSYSLSGFGALNPNGASLIVFFDDGNSANNRDVVIFDGNDSNINFAGIPGNSNAPADAAGWDVTLNGINYTSGAANIQMHVSDGQAFNDDAVILNGSTLIPAGPNFDGNTVPGANNGPSNNGRLWDIRSFAITSFLTTGPNTVHLTTGTNMDCLGLVVALIDLPAGAAPPPPQSAVYFDFMPRVCPNELNVKVMGEVFAAILSTPAFDARRVDVTTVRLNGIAPGRWGIDNMSSPFTGSLTDCSSCFIGQDTYRDLGMAFNGPAIVRSLGTVTDGQCLDITITANLLPAFGGTAITGTDKVLIKKR